MASQRPRKARVIDLEPLHARLPAFWWSEVTRIQRLIQQDADAACFEAEYMEYAAEALAQAEDSQLAHEHAPALWAASHQLKALALARRRLQQRGATARRELARPELRPALA